MNRNTLHTIILVLSSIVFFPALSLAEDVREWSDATGKFKISGSLVEVRDGVAFIKNTAGKTLKVPVNRLSKKDQEFLEGGDNPFEMVEEGSTPAGAATTPAAATPAASPGNSSWNNPIKVNWDDVKELKSQAGIAWNVQLTDGTFPFEAKRAPLSKKTNFHEHVHSVVINPICRRAVVGYSVTFTVPKPMSRLTLVDLVSGKSVHSEQIESHMRPLALLNSGSDVLMVGGGDGRRGGPETKDQLQLWRFNGTKISRTPSWVPYPDDKKAFGKVSNANVLMATPVQGNKMLTMADNGHLVLWDISSRIPIWHTRVNSRNFAMHASMDRNLLALVDDKLIMVVEIETGQILGSTALPASTHVGWPRVRWSPKGDRLLFSSMGDVRVLDVATGQWVQEMTFPTKPIAPNGLGFPNEDYALLNNNLLLHLPTKIQVCQYSGAASIATLGGLSFIVIQDGNGGVVVPAKFPHPAAEQLLQKAKSDPTMFLVHPGVGVAIDVSAVNGQHRQTAQAGLEKAAEASGYKIDSSSPIKIVASITGPKQEAISYIAAGSYIVNKYTSTIQLMWEGKELWKTSGTNVPGILSTKRGQTMQQALDEAGKQPNLSIFERTRFPEMMQKPSEDQKGPQRTNALMTSNFTPQGLVDSK